MRAARTFALTMCASPLTLAISAQQKTAEPVSAAIAPRRHGPRSEDQFWHLGDAAKDVGRYEDAEVDKLRELVETGRFPSEIMSTPHKKPWEVDVARSEVERKMTSRGENLNDKDMGQSTPKAQGIDRYPWWKRERAAQVRDEKIMTNLEITQELRPRFCKLPNHVAEHTYLWAMLSPIYSEMLPYYMDHYRDKVGLNMQKTSRFTIHQQRPVFPLPRGEFKTKFGETHRIFSAFRDFSEEILATRATREQRFSEGPIYHVNGYKG